MKAQQEMRDGWLLQEREQPRGVFSTQRRVVYPAFERDAAPVVVSAVSPRDEELPDTMPRSRQTADSLAPLQRGYQDRILLNDGVAERRRLYFDRLDPQKIREIRAPDEIPTVVPRYHHPHEGGKQPRRPTRYHQPHPHVAHVGMEPIYDRRRMEEMAAISQKRRRLQAPPSPPSQRRQPLYEPEYGLAVLERSKQLMRSRYSVSPPSAMDEGERVSRQRHSRSGQQETREADSFRSSAPRISYNSRERPPVAENVPVARREPLAPRTQESSAGKNESASLAAMVLKSKEFLTSKSLVRNRHDEIDWVATFLSVGFDSSSIYALMCPLRKGRWKTEEENYTLGLLRLIENGTILLRHGQSIRGFIGEKLHSDDMRVLKKLSNCKMFHFAKLINPRLAEEEKIDANVEGAREGLQHLDRLKSEFLRSVQLEALVAVRKYLSDSSLRDLLTVRN